MKEESDMKYYNLYNGVKMPALGLGTFRTGGDVTEQAVIDAIKCGYEMIDTAQGYDNEEFVGSAIRKSGVDRKDIFLVTKVNFDRYEDAYESVLESMDKLGVEYIDLVLLHWPFGNSYKAWRNLERIYREGKARAIGVSNFNPDRLVDLIKFNEIAPMVNQIETHLYCQRIEDHKWMEKYHVQHMGYCPLGQGSPEIFDEEEVRKIAEKYGRSPAQVMLRFNIQNDVALIPKSVHADRMKENLDIFDFELNEEEMDRLRALDRKEPKIGAPHTPEKVEFAMTWIGRE